MSLNPLLLLLAFCLSVPLRAAEPAKAGASGTAAGTNVPVLVVIDVQHFYFPGGAMPLHAPEAASAQARRLLAHFRTNAWPVVHVQHLPKG